VATKHHVLKVVPDAIGLRSHEVLVPVNGNITAMAVDIPAMMLYFATASPGGVHGLSVRSGDIFGVSIQNPATPYDYCCILRFLSIHGIVIIIIIIIIIIGSSSSRLVAACCYCILLLYAYSENCSSTLSP